MAGLTHVGFGLTFRGETLSLAAARACLRVVADEDVCGHLARTGRELRERLAAVAAAVGVDVRAVGPDARLTLQFARSGRLLPLGLQTLFVQECCKRGVLTNGNLLPSYAHDAQAVAATIVAGHGALEVVARAITADDLQPFLQVPVQAQFFGSDSAMEV
jgi:glutamate-1-semialdehyde aminotransferase